MCTVTIFPKRNDDFIITSNRDEAPDRVSLSPQIYTIANSKILFPKDELSGGTWIGVSDKNRMLCLLNGGFKSHERQTEYRLSRGTVVKELLASENIVEAIISFDFDGIEPFTLVISDWNKGLKFMELVWDGREKHFKNLPLEPKIWSSSTLYSESMKSERNRWFETFKKENTLNSDSLLRFHKTAGQNNLDYGVVMNRDFVKTTSITQIEKSDSLVEMQYTDLRTDKLYNTEFRSPLVVNE
jgi:hypothetical protein